MHPTTLSAGRGPRFTACDYGRAFLTLDRDRLGRALGLALDAIHARPAPSPRDAEDLHDDLLAAAELARVLAVADHPLIGSDLGRTGSDEEAPQ